MSDRLMDRMDDVLMGAMTDVTDDVWTVGNFIGFHGGNLPWFSPHYYWGIFDVFSADSDG